jgi:hypothetical protein
VSFSSNFTQVTHGVDPKGGPSGLFVEGKSVPANDTDEIHVAVPHGGELLKARVDAKGLTDWVARIPDGTTPFQVNEEVFVLGVAMRPEPHDPFVWQGSFTIQAKP